MTCTSASQHTSPPHIIDRLAAAAMLGTSERHVRRLAEDGRLPFVKIGGKQRFVVGDLVAFINSSRVAVGHRQHT